MRIHGVLRGYLAFALSACSLAPEAQSADTGTDSANALDAASGDARPLDSGSPEDGGSPDASEADAAPRSDAWLADAALLPDAGVSVDASGSLDAGQLIDAALVSSDAGPEIDAALADASSLDAGSPSPDAAGSMDTGPIDAGPMDAGPVDTGVRDGGRSDTGPLDAGRLDTGIVDAGVDGAMRDSGPPDSGAPDAGARDSGVVDRMITEADFQCIQRGQMVRSFFVWNLYGDIGGTLAVANSPTGGEYPPGTLIQLVPNEAMFKHAPGWNPATNDWEFFAMNVTASGVTFTSRGGENVVGPGGNCFNCHSQAAPQWDLVCETTHGCAPLGIPPFLIRLAQDTDPRCR